MSKNGQHNAKLSTKLAIEKQICKLTYVRQKLAVVYYLINYFKSSEINLFLNVD